ncbi:MAG: hypothetical protein ACRDON_05670 [Gaiellaceae bacterium]
MRGAALVVAFGLALAAPAAAKGPVTIEVCGMDGCAIAGKEQAHSTSTLLNWVELELTQMPPPGPYYEIRRRAGWLEDEVPIFYIPSADVLRLASNWLVLDERTATRLRVAARGLEPWPWTGVQEASVGGRKAQNPLLYEALLRPLPATESPPYDADRMPVIMLSRVKRSEHQLTPWTNRSLIVDWLPAHGVVYRDGEWLRIPGWLDETLRRDAGLNPPPPPVAIEPERAASAELVAGAVLAVALFLAGSFLAVRRSLAA